MGSHFIKLRLVYTKKKKINKYKDHKNIKDAFL